MKSVGLALYPRAYDKVVGANYPGQLVGGTLPNEYNAPSRAKMRSSYS